MPKAVWNATVIAESDDVEVVDGYTYSPSRPSTTGTCRASDRRWSLPGRARPAITTSSSTAPSTRRPPGNAAQLGGGVGDGLDDAL
jgi:hypothetical protein